MGSPCCSPATAPGRRGPFLNAREHKGAQLTKECSAQEDVNYCGMEAQIPQFYAGVESVLETPRAVA
jgi:hypothetical protein